ELLRHLHVHAKENIILIFTNARAVCFQPGLSACLVSQLLQNFIEQLNIEVPFSKKNTFLFDNGGFKFMALYKKAC
ncbi:unnamed protein product, partial [Rotaria sp. Silwood2]